MIKEALQYIASLAVESESIEVIDICGRTYANKNLYRYDNKDDHAEPMQLHTLSAVVDYISSCNNEFPGDMILHIVSPTKVRLMSELDGLRKREVLVEAEAIISDFPFGKWMDQEQFMVSLQANFIPTADLEAVKKMAGNIDQKKDVNFADDGISQLAVINVGVAAKADAIVPNPVLLIPYRTFQEIPQPESDFVFRISDGDKPSFKLVESGGKMWRNQAINYIKAYFSAELSRMDEQIRSRITVIG